MNYNISKIFYYHALNVYNINNLSDLQISNIFSITSSFVRLIQKCIMYQIYLSLSHTVARKSLVKHESIIEFYENV